MRKASQLQCWALGAFALGLLALAAWSQTPGPQAGAGPIRITVRVPADAKITVDGNPTRQTGPVRFFESPPVPAGKKFFYTLKITWTEAGKEKSITKRVAVTAGDNQLDYRTLLGEGAKDKRDATKTDKPKVDEDKKDADKKDDKDLKDLDKKKEDSAVKDAEKKKDDKDLKDGKKNPDDEAAAPRSREFLFTYAATVTGLKPGQVARVWVPVPPSTDVQRVRMVSQAHPFRG
jgi:uncharacterized protein (TIGR03000 family)